MGESYAQNVGVSIRPLRVMLILLSSLLSACVTAFAGPISFVGIAVPHLVKSVVKTTKPIVMIPVSFLGGGVFCVLCDLLARTIFAPVELSISSVTAVFLAPVVRGECRLSEADAHRPCESSCEKRRDPDPDRTKWRREIDNFKKHYPAAFSDRRDGQR